MDFQIKTVVCLFYLQVKKKKKNDISVVLFQSHTCNIIFFLTYSNSQTVKYLACDNHIICDDDMEIIFCVKIVCYSIKE